MDAATSHALETHRAHADARLALARGPRTALAILTEEQAREAHAAATAALHPLPPRRQPILPGRLQPGHELPPDAV